MSMPTVLVLPFPAQGHVNPMVILSEKLVEHGCKVVFVNTEIIHKRVMSSMMEQQHSLDESKIKLVSIPDGLGPDDDRNAFGKWCDAILATMPTSLEKLIEDIHLKGEDKISFIVADFFMAWAMDVAAKLGIKGAIFCPCSAAVFATVYRIPNLLHDGILNSDGSMVTTIKTIQLLPGMPEMGTEVFYWLRIGDTINFTPIFNYLVHCARSTNLTEQWICDTANEFEPRVLPYFPKIIPIGPLLRSYENTNATTRSLGQFWEEDLSCMDWLDQQPHGSVTYVAFGSFTLFDQNQFNELALGLDFTNRPFLWVVRQDHKMTFPSNFQGKKGKIVAWAPQQKVLSHCAISCFITHCGWNSTMESLSNGVPLLCWPYFADQFYNKLHICDELSVGMALNSNENGVVSRWEIIKKLDQLLSNEKIRTRSLKLKEKVRENQRNKGLSLENINKFVKWLKE